MIRCALIGMYAWLTEVAMDDYYIIGKNLGLELSLEPGGRLDRRDNSVVPARP